MAFSGTAGLRSGSGGSVNDHKLRPGGIQETLRPGGIQEKSFANVDAIHLEERTYGRSKLLPFSKGGRIVKHKSTSVTLEAYGQDLYANDDLPDNLMETPIWTTKRQLNKLKLTNLVGLKHGLTRPKDELSNMITQMKDPRTNELFDLEANLQGTIEMSKYGFSVEGKLTPTSGTLKDVTLVFNARALRIGKKMKLYIVGSESYWKGTPRSHVMNLSDDIAGKVIIEQGRGIVLDAVLKESGWNFNRKVWMIVTIKDEQICIDASANDYEEWSRKYGWDSALFEDFGLETQSGAPTIEMFEEKYASAVEELNSWRKNASCDCLYKPCVLGNYCNKIQDNYGMRLQVFQLTVSEKKVVRDCLMEAVKMLRMQQRMNEELNVPKHQQRLKMKYLWRSVMSDPLMKAMKQTYCFCADSYFVSEVKPIVSALQNSSTELLVTQVEDDELGLFARVKQLIGMVYDKTKSVSVWIGEFLKKALRKLMDFFSWMSDSIARVFENLVEKFISTFMRMIDPNGILARIRESPPESVISLIGVSVVICVVAGLITSQLLVGFVRRFVLPLFSDMFDSDHVDLTTQSGIEKTGPGVLVGLVCAMFGGMTGADQKVLKEKATTLTALAAGGTVVMSLGLYLFTFIPQIYREAITRKFGTRDMILEMETDEWIAEAKAIYSTSTIPSVLTSDDFRTDLKEILVKGSKILGLWTTTSAQRTVMVGIYSKLLALNMNLEQYRNGQIARPLPFGVHLAGKPGVGKTILAAQLMSSVFNKMQDDVYTKAQDNFTGYINQSAVFWDEFLSTGTPDDQIEDAKVYLSLISTAVFKPDMDSLTNPLIGVKGTCVTPDVVITANNSAYANHAGVSCEALQRRRQVVLNIALREDARVNASENNVDMFWYKSNGFDIKKMPWAKFQILPGQRHSGWESSAWVDYDAMITSIKALYVDFKETREMMDEFTGIDVNGEKPPREIIDSALRSIKGMKQPSEVLDVIVGAVTQNGESETEEVFQKPKRRKGKSKKKQIHTDSEVNQLKKDVEDGFKRLRAFEESCDSNEEVFTAEEGSQDEASSVTSTVEQFCERKTRATLDNTVKQLDYQRVYKDNGELETITEMIKRHLSKFVELRDELDFAANRYYVSLANQCSDADMRMAYLNIAQGVRVPSFKKIFLVYLGLGLGLLAIKSWLFGGSRAGEDKITFEVQSQIPRKERTKSHWRSTRQMRNFETQSGLEIPIATATLNYTRRVDDKVFDVVTHPFYVIPLKERKFLTFRHNFTKEDGEQIEAGAILKLNLFGKTYETDYDPKMTVAFTGSETTVFEFGCKQLPLQRDILKRFVNQETFENLTQFHTLMENNLEGRREAIHGSSKIEENVSYSGQGRRWNLSVAVTTTAATVKGQCGLPLRIVEGIGSGKIIAIHVAGGTNGFGRCKAISSPAIEEDLREMCDFLDKGNNIEIETQSGGNYYRELKSVEEELHNLESLEFVPFEQRIFLPEKSKLEPSAISEFLGFEDVKQPSILSVEDPRAKGVDPFVNSLIDTLKVEHPQVDQSLVKECEEIVFRDYEKNLYWSPDTYRNLTLEEAVSGLPGVLASMKVQTSPGLPLVYLRSRQGKKDWIRFGENGSVFISPAIVEMVKVVESKMKRGDHPDTVFLGYLKDELVNPSKIDPPMTRVIYCFDLVHNIVYRKKFGGLLAAFNNSYNTTPSAIGINQYSHDMEAVYQYLTNDFECNLQAGDYKGFDKRYHPVFRAAAYNIIRRLAGDLVDDVEWKYFLESQTQSPAQVGSVRFKATSNHMSGLLFTTPVNNLVNQLYFTYIFKKVHPDKIVSESIRLKVLGDDNILAIRKGIDFPGNVIQSEMAKIGQLYTSDKKDEEVKDYQTIDEITFLGASFRKLDGKYTGAALEKTLYRAISWTRDKNASLVDVCEQVIGLASQHSEVFYDEFVAKVRRALIKAGYEPPEYPCWAEMSRVVAGRRAGTGLDYCTDYFTTQSSSACLVQDNGFEMVCPLSGCKFSTDKTKILRKHIVNHLENNFILRTQSGESAVRGLTTFHTTGVKNYEQPPSNSLAHIALNETEFDLKTGMDTVMFRENIEWSTSAGIGDVLGSWTAPYGILAKNATNNIQNMVVQRLQYLRTDVELTVQINATPFQTGMLVLYWYPLSATTSLEEINWTTQPHVLLSPYTNSTATLRIAYNFPRSVLNNSAGLAGDARESLGVFVLGVMSPLNQVDATQTVSVNVYSRFPESKSTIPQVEQSSSLEPKLGVARRAKQLTNMIKIDEEPTIQTMDDFDLETQGANSSKSKGNTTIYNIEHVAGSVPIQTGPQQTTGNSQAISPEVKTDAQIVPMDKPILAGSSVPIQPMFGTMNKSNGIDVTHNLALHPETMMRQHASLIDTKDMDIASMCERPSLLWRLTWKATDAPDTRLIDIPLNSILGHQVGDIMPASLAVINYFTYFRCDFVFKIMAIRTPYHVGRIRAVPSYGSPGPVPDADQNKFYNHILDFNSREDGESDFNVMRVPYNHQNEYLRTYEGPAQLDPVQRHSLGFLSLFVATQLRATSTVAPDIELLIFVHLENVRVAIPRPYNFIRPGLTWTSAGIVLSVSGDGDSIECETQAGPEDSTEVASNQYSREEGSGNIDDKAVSSVDVTEQEAPISDEAPCKLFPGQHFEYNVTNFAELQRRYIPCDPLYTTQTYSSGHTSAKASRFFTPEPMLPGVEFAAAWGGGLKYRIFQITDALKNTTSPMALSLLPYSSTGDISILNAELMNPGAAVTANGVTATLQGGNAGGLMAREYLYPQAGTAWIDFKVNLFTQYDYLVVPENIDNHQSPDPANVTGPPDLTVCFEMEEDDVPVAFNIAAADEFRCGIWRCPPGLVLDPYTLSGANPPDGTYNFGGWLETFSS